MCARLDDVALSVAVVRNGEGLAQKWVLEALCDARPDPESFAARLGFCVPEDQWRIAALADRDWLAHVHAVHPPFSVGPFFVRESGRVEPPPVGSILLTIDAVTAFGSGAHGTTAGCLEALGDLAQQNFMPRSILDMGAGSGILAIAAWLLWRAPVLAVDIERESVRVACRHRALNGVPAGPKGMVCAQGGRFDISAIARRAPFDLITANILAGPLRALAPDLWAATAPEGRVVLSGMLHEQAAEVFAAYAALGAVMDRRIERGEWTSLVLAKP